MFTPSRLLKYSWPFLNYKKVKLENYLKVSILKSKEFKKQEKKLIWFKESNYYAMKYPWEEPKAIEYAEKWANVHHYQNFRQIWLEHFKLVTVSN